MAKTSMATTTVAIALLASPLLAQTTTPRPPATGTEARAVDRQRLIGRAVTNSRSEAIGEIRDVVVSADGRVTDVVLGVGGLLGFGEHRVALPWERLRFGRPSEDAIVALTGATGEQLKASPSLERDRHVWVRG